MNPSILITIWLSSLVLIPYDVDATWASIVSDAKKPSSKPKPRPHYHHSSPSSNSKPKTNSQPSRHGQSASQRHSSRFHPNQEMSTFVTKLWNMDDNAAIAGRDFTLDKQGYVTNAHYAARDFARRKLFKEFNAGRIFSKPTYRTFKNLLDNYELQLGRAEEQTHHERKEQDEFLDAICNTAVMKEAHKFLVSKRKVQSSLTSFKFLLHRLWFKLYRRTRNNRSLDSCGFEHVFVGETRDQKVLGFHNWLQLYLQELHGNANYYGYFRRGTEDVKQPRLMTMQFKLFDYSKPIGSSFIGTSPEFEMALYTVIYMMDIGSKVPIRINGELDLEVVVHSFGRGIGTAYPNGK